MYQRHIPSRRFLHMKFPHVSGRANSFIMVLPASWSPPFQLHILIKSPQDTPSIPSTLNHRQSQFFLQDSLWICKKVTTSHMFFGRARESQIGNVSTEYHSKPSMNNQLKKSPAENIETISNIMWLFFCEKGLPIVDE